MRTLFYTKAGHWTSRIGHASSERYTVSKERKRNATNARDLPIAVTIRKTYRDDIRATLKPGKRSPESGIGNQNPEIEVRIPESGIRNPNFVLGLP